MNNTSAAEAQRAETAGERTGGCPCGRIRFITRGPAWYETFEAQAKGGFCPTCGCRLAAIDSDVTEIDINATALGDTSAPDLVPIHMSFRHNAGHWLPPVPGTEHSTAG
ncbi:hypothetical protein [Streptomyces sp. NPDC088115]|uniref:hypothetical protein n=1 Tax=Streptomyces sp. NPDC088115 TaxID=3365824 RepID=UPI0038260ED7